MVVPERKKQCIGGFTLPRVVEQQDVSHAAVLLWIVAKADERPERGVFRISPVFHPAEKRPEMEPLPVRPFHVDVRRCQPEGQK